MQSCNDDHFNVFSKRVNFKEEKSMYSTGILCQLYTQYLVIDLSILFKQRSVKYVM